MKFMATNTGSLVAAANAIGNVPTTFDSLESPDLSLPEQFDTFLDVFSNPNSHYKDMSIARVGGPGPAGELRGEVAVWPDHRTSKPVSRTSRNRSTTSSRRRAVDREGGAIAGTVTAAARRPVSKRRPARGRARRYGTVSLFMLPWIIGFVVFIAYPMIASLYYSFTNYDLLEDPTWVGLQNYRFMFTKDPMFWQAMRNTLWIIAVGVPLQIVTSLSLAWLLTRPKRGSRYYRTFLFLPTMVPPVAAALGFRVPVQPGLRPDQPGTQGGGRRQPAPMVLQRLLVEVGPGLPQPVGRRTDDDRSSSPASWMSLASCMRRPRSRAPSSWQRFRFVTLPMISPVMFFSVVIGVIAGFQYFTQAYVASFAVSGQPTGGASSNIGGPEESTLFYSLHLYIKGFAHFQMGYASAMAWILFIIIMACTIVIIRTSRRWVHYQGGFR